jgi:DNA-binding NtrC family response regulator
MGTAGGHPVAVETSSEPSTEEQHTREEVVLVDDDPGFVETFSALLRHEGYSVVSRPTYAAALDYLTEHSPDVLITDIRLGGHSGWKLAKYASARKPKIRVIVVTGLADHLEAELEYWRLPVFLKPFNPDQLLEHLKSGD